VNRHFYWRQLRDMKGSVLVEVMTPFGLTFHSRTCGWVSDGGRRMLAGRR
jgi:hypothetical protein